MKYLLFFFLSCILSLFLRNLEQTAVALQQTRALMVDTVEELTGSVI